MNKQNKNNEVKKITLAEMVQEINKNQNENGKTTTLKEVKKDLSNDFSVIDPLTVLKTTLKIKPAMLQELDQQNNKVIIITCEKIKDYFQYFAFYFDNGKIKNFDNLYFCNIWTNKTNAEHRNNAIFTYVIYQNYKYIKAMNEKKQSRAGKTTAPEKYPRYIWAKDYFIENCTDPEIRQRYKYYLRGFDPKQYKHNLQTNLLLTQKFLFDSRGCCSNYNIVMDKSGYRVDLIREELKRKAHALKDERIKNNFLNNKKDYFINALQEKTQETKKNIFVLYSEAVKSDNLTNILNVNYFMDEKINEYLKVLARYSAELQKAEFYQGIENDILSILNLSFAEMLKNFNNFLNLEQLHNRINENLGYFNFKDLQKKFGYEYGCPINNFKTNLYKIENNNLYYLGYTQQINNFFDFVKSDLLRG